MIYTLGFISVLFALKLCWNMALPFEALRADKGRAISLHPEIEVLLLTAACVLGWVSSFELNLWGISSWAAVFGLGLILIILSYAVQIALLKAMRP